MIYRLTIPIFDGLDKIEIQNRCEQYGCELYELNETAGTFTIISDAIVNFFWLGCNWNNEFLNQLIKSSSSLLKNNLKNTPAKDDFGIF